MNDLLRTRPVFMRSFCPHVVPFAAIFDVTPRMKCSAEAVLGHVTGIPVAIACLDVVEPSFLATCGTDPPKVVERARLDVPTFVYFATGKTFANFALRSHSLNLRTRQFQLMFVFT